MLHYSWVVANTSLLFFKREAIFHQGFQDSNLLSRLRQTHRTGKKEARPTSVYLVQTWAMFMAFRLIKIAANTSHRSLKVLAKLLSFIFPRPYSCSSGDSGKRVAILQKPWILIFDTDSFRLRINLTFPSWNVSCGQKRKFWEHTQFIWIPWGLTATRL